MSSHGEPWSIFVFTAYCARCGTNTAEDLATENLAKDRNHVSLEGGTFGGKVLSMIIENVLSAIMENAFVICYLHVLFFEIAFFPY